QVRIGSPHDGPVLTFALPRPRGAESVTQAAAPMPAATARSGEPRAQEPPPTQELAPPREPAPTQELPPVEHPAPATQPLPPAQTAPAQTAPATPPSRSRPDAPVVSPVVSALEPPLPAPPAPSAPPRRVREAPGTPVGRPEIAAFDAAGTTTIGRSARCDIVLYDLLVSRRHAMIRQVGQEHHLIDLGSTNGTYLNGRRISRAVLRAGDLVSIGHYELTFDGRRLHERVDAGPISLTAERITVD